ncbi:lantibiotic dehydratase [Nonomuraea sp. NPDC050153]|uniref:lantibiotic dehydratase n=1 Tax=Nonomuraea sp. NPDC050153 TaxID=3364359 RepID=UPI0037ADBD09
MTASDFFPLPGGDWSVWRGMLLRGAGFPVRQVEAISDPLLASAADQCIKAKADQAQCDDVAGYEAEFAVALTRIADAVQSVATDPRLREAVVWQNPHFLDTCLDWGGAKHGGRDSAVRRREMAIANYLQRYTTKNDSIGFFGPVGWAEWDASATRPSMLVGSSLLSRRSVSFEVWGIDAVGAALAGRPELRHGVPPRRVPAHRFHDDHVVLASGERVPLSADTAAILQRCDGVRTVREIAEELAVDEEQLLVLLDELCDRDLLRLDFEGPVEARSEQRLRARLARVPEPEARQRALDDLDRLIRAKDDVAAAAGDPTRLRGALEKLHVEFQQLTGSSAVRSHGKTYGARTTVYEDTVRNIAVTLSGDMLNELGEPLSLVLDSVRWLASRIARGYLSRLDALYDRACLMLGTAEVPLARLLALATRDFYLDRDLPPLVRDAVEELQRRWAGILAIPDGVQRYRVEPAEIVDQVRAEFATSAPPWARGLHHSPDVLLGAESIDAISRGDYQFVLGELHMTHNTVEIQTFADQHPDPDRLLAMTHAAVGEERMVLIVPRAWEDLTRTILPASLMSPHYRYWTRSADDVSHVPGDVIPLGALTVARVDETLMVRSDVDDRRYPLSEVLGDYLSMVSVNAFRMLPRRQHHPRVSIGRLVVARETWRFSPSECSWAYAAVRGELNEQLRYLRMREWVARNNLPRRAFYSVSLETKPAYVDFTSLPLINSLASTIRRMAKDGSDGDISFTEMLPAPQECWLSDGDGERYTSELRMVVTERAC